MKRPDRRPTYQTYPDGWGTSWRTEARKLVEVRQACADGKTLFWASNFSIGVAIFSAVNRYLAKIMNQFPQYDVEMEETHHVHKLDHPSGTAITLADEIVENIDRKEAWAEDTTDPKFLRVDHIRRSLSSHPASFILP